MYKQYQKYTHVYIRCLQMSQVSVSLCSVLGIKAGSKPAPFKHHIADGISFRRASAALHSLWRATAWLRGDCCDGCRRDSHPSSTFKSVKSRAEVVFECDTIIPPLLRRGWMAVGESLFWEIGNSNWLPQTLPFLHWGCSRCAPVIYSVAGLKRDSVVALGKRWGVFPPSGNWMNHCGSSLLRSVVFIQRCALSSNSMQSDRYKSVFSVTIVFSCCLLIQLLSQGISLLIWPNIPFFPFSFCSAISH